MRPLLPYLLLVAAVAAQEKPPPAKHLLPPGIEIPAAARAELTAGAAELKAEIDGLRGPASSEAANRGEISRRLPDVEVLWKAVDWALRYDEFYSLRQLQYARQLLQEGRARVEALGQNTAPWVDRGGLVIHGYRSKLDESVQPYTLLIPSDLDRSKPLPLEIWLSGRDDKRSELAFMAHGTDRPPPVALPGTLVLWPYGRYCNAYKFGGEVDIFEALQAVKRDFRIDDRRIVLVGFSMGGAGVWHLATHHPDVWCVATPGAGFVGTAQFTGALAPGMPPRAWWEPMLWNWYDVVPYAENLADCPVLAYSGEIDPQKQSADIMEEAAARNGLKLERFIGPHTGHKYEPAAKEALIARLRQFEAAGRSAVPDEVDFATCTLRYPGSDWVQVEGMEHHWVQANVRAKRLGDDAVEATTSNISQIAFDLPGLTHAVIDGQTVDGTAAEGAAPPRRFHKEGGVWKAGALPAGLRKRPGLTGPIDDAFMEPFLFVRPTGRSANPAVARWVNGELRLAQRMWRGVFRGEAPVKDDTEVTPDDIRQKNLILWGDPDSNLLIGRIAGRLPVRWGRDGVTVGSRRFPAADSAPILIYPNPLHPDHYVVINSGIDFRDEAYTSNALQVPKLPDWAVIDLSTPPGLRWPGKIAAAGFFDEQWRLQPDDVEERKMPRP